MLHSFQRNGKDGVEPTSALVFDARGNLYGTTNGDGSYQYSSVFELTPGENGKWREKVLHMFQSNGKGGYAPYGAVTFDAAGNLYGTTYGGGDYDDGTVFELVPAVDGRWKEQVIHSFEGEAGDGMYPYAGLTLGTTGHLYGTTRLGGTYGAGAVFELSRDTGGRWKEKLLHSFDDNGYDAWMPCAALALDGRGNLYGTTYYGGTHSLCGHGCGTVYEVTP